MFKESTSLNLYVLQVGLPIKCDSKEGQVDIYPSLTHSIIMQANKLCRLCKFGKFEAYVLTLCKFM